MWITDRFKLSRGWNLLDQSGPINITNELEVFVWERNSMEGTCVATTFEWELERISHILSRIIQENCTLSRYERKLKKDIELPERSHQVWNPRIRPPRSAWAFCDLHWVTKRKESRTWNTSILFKTKFNRRVVYGTESRPTNINWWDMCQHLTWSTMETIRIVGRKYRRLKTKTH